MMVRTVLAHRLLSVAGVLILVVAAIHLLITPVLRRSVLGKVLTQEARQIVEPPFLLNHIVVGILLIPIGLSTIYSARGIRSGERWAWVISLFNALSLLSLPVVLLVVMRAEHFRALPFLVAASSITVVGLGMTIVTIWVRPFLKRSNDGKEAA